MPTLRILRTFGPQAALAVLLLLALSLGTLGVRAAVSLSSQSSTPAAPAVLRWGNEGISDLYTLDPARGPDYNALQAVQLVFGGLVRTGPDFRILPDASDRWQIGDGGRTYTFHLRPNVRFGDGTLLVATDVAYSLNRVLSKEFADRSNAYLLSDIVGADAVTSGHAAQASGIQVLDARTIRIRIVRPTGSFLAKLASQAGLIVPSWRGRADPQGWDQTAFGTGPFKVARWVHNEALLLVPNPYYYGGKLRISGVYMPFIPEPLAAYKRYREDAIDIMGTVHFPPQALYDAEGETDFHRSAFLRTVYLTLNTRRPPFNDVRIRLALAHAIDKRSLAHDVFGDLAHPTDGMLPPGILGYNPALRGAGYDPMQARLLLSQAGYPGGRGLQAITFIVDQDAQFLALARDLAQQWQHVLGIHVVLQQLNHSAYIDQLQRFDYQIAAIDWTRDYPDPQNFLSQLLHSGSPNNNGDWRNPTFDRLVDQADHMVAADPARLAIYHRAEQIAMDQAAAIPLVNPTSGILLRSTVHGLQINGGQVMAADWTQVTITPETTP
jgi:oligopeptide transport system substrate-binding protein